MTPLAAFATKSAEDTREVAGQIAALARLGDVVLLAGGLGSGKTTFAQGFGRALGVAEPIVSPTFTLVRSYVGRIRLIHADVYRLDHLQEVVDLGLPELVEDGVTLVEWGDVAAPALPPDFLEVRLEWGDGEDDGPGWASRQRAVVAALDRWAVA